jgi:hypothetical protein
MCRDPFFLFLQFKQMQDSFALGLQPRPSPTSAPVAAAASLVSADHSARAAAITVTAAAADCGGSSAQLGNMILARTAGVRRPPHHRPLPLFVASSPLFPTSFCNNRPPSHLTCVLHSSHPPLKLSCLTCRFFRSMTNAGYVAACCCRTVCTAAATRRLR